MFVHLHSHSTYSSYDGFGTPDDRARHVKSIEQTALACTDHGTTSGLIGHYHACKRHGIKPILGVEAYYQPVFTPSPEAKRYHMTILAMDREGYQNLNVLMTLAASETFYRYPIVTWEQLTDHSQGLIVLSGCIAGYIPQQILPGNNEEAERAFVAFKNLLGDRFYGEVMPFQDSDQQQAKVNEGILSLAEKYDVKSALTNDSHFTTEADRETHALMFQIKGHSPEADYSHLYLCEQDQIMGGWYETMSGSRYWDPRPYLKATAEIAERCNVELDFQEAIPRLEWDKPSDVKLVELCKQGLKEKGKYSGPENTHYRERLAYEFEVISTKGYIDYFLLCYDIYQYARENGIAYGFGRGSVCGSLLAYAIGLTNVDPIMFGLSFERFLRPNKTTLPDIDMDFESSRRQEIISYLLAKYAGRAAPISTFGYYKVKNLANDLGKALGADDADLKIIKHALERLLTDEDAYQLEDKSGLHQYLLSDPELERIDQTYNNIIRHFSRLFGQVRYVGKHAAGVAITDGPIEQYTALIHTKDGLQTAYDLNDLGKINVVKIDCLGLATVDVVADVERRIGKQYDIYSLLQDRKTYRAFGAGKVEGVFQFESNTAKDVCKRIKPINMQELIAANAMNRPAPIKLGLLDAYIKGKVGKARKGSHLYQHTQDTYGTLIYQEHVMSLALWAGLEWAEIDKLIKGISKKTAGKDVIRAKFIAGCIHNGLKEEDAGKLYDGMTLYLFNKSHGAGYSLMSFYSMFLKLHHPLEYWSAMLRHEQTETKRTAYELEAVRAGIGILLPNVNGKANYDTTIDQDGDSWIRRGLGTIPGIGKSVANSIETAAPYTDKFDLVGRLPRRVLTSRVMAALEDSGALCFDSQEQHRRSVAYCEQLQETLKALKLEESKKK